MRHVTELILLGTGNALASQKQENSHMLLVGANRRVLIDTATNPIARLQQAGIDPISLTDLILTHFHPDHVSGVPILLLDSWLLGRQAPLNIYGLQYTLERLEKMMALFDWGEWPNFFPVNFHPLAMQEMVLVLECDEFVIYASPVQHIIPNIGLRIEIPASGKVFAYSCDTEPTQAVVRLAQGADILIHEATGAEFGHSSAAQAGAIAKQSGAARLVLIHYDLERNNLHELLEQARSTFTGPIDIATDFMSIK